MNAEKINRSYLETLSFSDLSKLADEYGVDVPENFDRRLLIGELLELVEEGKASAGENMVISSDKLSQDSDDLPSNYNETQISCILRNPVWAFVFWNISESDQVKLKELDDCNIMIRVCILASDQEIKPVESFEVNASLDSQEQYILLPAGKQFFRFELVYVAGATGKVLAFSPVITIPQGGEALNNFQPGKEDDYSEIIKLSGINKVLMEQYTNHRHSFS
ncbi:MAG: DUF4912 domain-containing protein [Treponema sp.]|nr:DUF4912 domain-containing protein [Treponema sp.]